MSDDMPGNSTPEKCSRWREFRASGAPAAIVVAGLFFAAATAILMLRQQVIAFRPGQYVGYNITSRVDFDFADTDQLDRMRQRAREQEPRVYRAAGADYWGALRDELLTLPDRTYRHVPAELPADLQTVLDPGDLSALEREHDHDKPKYDQAVERFVEQVRHRLTVGGEPLVILPAEQRQDELNRTSEADQAFVRYVTLYPAKFDPAAAAVAEDAKTDVDQTTVRRATVSGETLSTDLGPEVLTQLQDLADPLPLALKPAIAQLTFLFLRTHPTHALDLAATKAAQDRAAADVSLADATERYPHDTVIVPKGPITDRDWQVLRAENQAYLGTGESGVEQWCGTALIVFMLTVVLSAYVAKFQPRVMRNAMRATALAGLMIAMLLVSGLSGIGSGSLYLFGIAPTIVAAIILTIAYDQRFAVGVASVEAVLVTFGLHQEVGFFLILLVGILVACFMLDDVRTRSKLIEVGGMAAIAMMVVTAATQMTSLEAMRYVMQNTLYAGAAGLAAGFVILGILPFIERTFHITTSMTLLELADANQPLLRRLAIEAPGTYNHSLQVATLSNAAAEAIGANALVCRVGAYYHDVGKINKADYFAENQLADGPNRHLNLSPNVSLGIIIGHVRDGMTLAREHHLPPTLLQFIQQHHGTTLVEYFYNEACRKQAGSETPAVSETQFRYPGPKPKSRETAILMLADCCESACRAMQQPNAEKIESLVHELVDRRVRDGQFDECDLTMRDIDRIQRSLVKTLLGIYHGRLAYPSMSRYQTVGPMPPAQPVGSRKLA